MYNSVKENIDKGIVIQAILKQGLANYFETSSAFDDLVTNGNLVPADDEHKTYALTENGVEIAKQLDSILAYSIKEKAYACAVKLLAVKKNEIEKGGHPNKGVVFIDYPKDLSKVSKVENPLPLVGWQISDSDDAMLNVYFDGELQSLFRIPREDVFEAYQESYPGNLDKNTIGWQVNLDVNKIQSGKHKVYVECVEPDGYKLSDKEIEFT